MLIEIVTTFVLPPIPETTIVSLQLRQLGILEILN